MKSGLKQLILILSKTVFEMNENNAVSRDRYKLNLNIPGTKQVT